jgi:cytochrome c peroxidase
MRWNRMLLAITLFAAPPALPALAQGPPPPPPPLTPLPPPPQPAGNLVTPGKANLGRVLFWDEQLSATRTVACGSCHQAGAGGSDPRSLPLAAHARHPGLDALTPSPDDVIGSPGVVLNDLSGAMQWSSIFGLRQQVTSRLAPSMINAAYAPELFWDGRADGTFRDPVTNAVVLPAGGALESQAAGPPASAVEMGHTSRDWTAIAAQIAGAAPLALATDVPASLATWINGRDYPALFQEAFGSPAVTPTRILLAIATYERTLFSTQTPFDSVIAGTATLRPQEAAGMQLFGQLPCAGCHGGALTSDNRFHYIGVRPAAEDSGRMIVTHDPVDLGAFRTPSLRNASLRKAFMHNGRFATLAQVVDFYDRGGDFDAPNKAPGIVPLNLTPQQKAALVAFLGRPLTDPRVAASSAPFDRPSLFGESALVPQILLPGGAAGALGVPQPVALEPALAGNPRFTIGVSGAAPGAAAVLVVDDAEPPVGGAIPAVASFARVSVALGSGPSGFGSATLAIPDDPGSAGRTLYARWYVEDATAPGGIAASPAVRFQIFGPHGAGSGAVAVTPPPAPDGPVRLHAAQPNPFTTRTSVRFDLAQAARLRLDVYDVTGRRVRELARQPLAMPGSYVVAWDGTADDGHAVGAGVYFVRLETDRGARSTRVTRIE